MRKRLTKTTIINGKLLFWIDRRHEDDSATSCYLEVVLAAGEQPFLYVTNQRGFSGSITGKTTLRKLAKEILKAIGDQP